MTSRAQLSQERSRLRRDALLSAAIELFVEGGSRAVTHRAVAAAAGLPAATTTYYFASIDDLLREALHQHIDHWFAAMEVYAALDWTALLEQVDVTSAVQLTVDLFERRPASVATRELTVILGAARDPHLRDAAVLALTASVEVLQDVFTALAIPDPTGLAEDIESLIGGVSIRRAAGVYSEVDEAAKVIRAIRHLVAGHLLDDATVDAALAAARERALSGRSVASP